MSLERELRRQAREDAFFMTVIAGLAFVAGAGFALLLGAMG